MRMRRLRENALTRNLIRETHLSKDDLIYPIFAVEGTNIKSEIPSMPDCYHYSIDRLNEEIEELKTLGINYVLIFGVPNEKDKLGSSAYDDNGIVQRAVKEIKRVNSGMYVITDVCMCQYTSHGHCGILDKNGNVLNDETLEYLSKIALSHVKAGADMVAPSDMMDFRIAHMRKALDDNGYLNIPIMAYSAKYATSFYGPFRSAAGSAPQFGDRKSYQMDIANSDEAVREMALDIEEGADIIMVKPALTYLDIIRRAKDNFNIPLAAYNVSGEYSMVKTAVLNGILDKSAIFESVLAIKRAGADIIITYFAKDIAKILNGGR
ncbi:porphobilinogen synthase [Sedimentibacter acidaminivorans]|jgi:porphobilinogen synthase|uniref:Delta-aminolevulinic acid dehydratase n=1 Tax=Sedimentibacter acidaminivorans TaxID=913099 RepID=A0ABS4GEP4_9FIRM|nr:porphobilinogen synthase [Sedimentibacter acidaminivorans]MBP1926166.1 porphobilinogen synthase [Sedimentibacter acidaminivorans]